MLFLGTKQHPAQGDYDRWLSEHGGGGNAYTDHHETNFYFEVDPSYLQPTLERFSEFFVSPLLSATHVGTIFQQ